MAIWDRLRQELDRAGKITSDAVDEGRLRLDLFRARQNADRFAQKLGYAVYRARTTAGEINPDEYAALSNDLRSAESEVARFETMVAEVSRRRKGSNLPATTHEAPPTTPPTNNPAAGPGASRNTEDPLTNDALTNEPPPREPPLT